MLKYILILLVALAGCSSDPAEPNRVHQEDDDDDIAEEGFVADFQLVDKNGNPTTEFLFGQDIFFKIKVTNQTGEDQPWTGAYYQVPFGFYVYDIGAEPRTYMGSTLDGIQFSCDPDSGIFGQDSTVTHKASWFEWSGHMVLPAGEYRACVGFTFWFEDICPVVEPIAFTVTLSNPDDEHIFSVFHMPGMGFFPREGRFLWAHIVRSEWLGFDRYILVGE